MRLRLSRRVPGQQPVHLLDEPALRPLRELGVLRGWRRNVGTPIAAQRLSGSGLVAIDSEPYANRYRSAGATRFAMEAEHGGVVDAGVLRPVTLPGDRSRVLAE